MMIGEIHRPNPTVQVPPWPIIDDQTAEIYGSPDYNNNLSMTEALAALQLYFPPTDPDFDSDSEFSGPDSPIDAYSCDHFRMYEFKVRRCARGRSHDWTECPFAHPGEKARRRDPRKYHYSGTACPDFRKGACKKGDSCEFAHGVFECWLHPARYRTQPCKDGTNCRRRVCFFAHAPEQLRVLPQQSPRSVNSGDSYDGSPLRLAIEASCRKALPFSLTPVTISSPGSPRGGDVSPPLSPMTGSLSRSLGSGSINDLVSSIRNMQLEKVKSMPAYSMQMGCSSGLGSTLRPGFCSLPNTPTRAPTRILWEQNYEEPIMERVESGKCLRAKMLEKLSKENSLENSGGRLNPGNPDVDWVSELVK